MQLAKYTALIGNNGKTVEPHFVRGYIDRETSQIVPLHFKEINLDISPKAFELVQEGMFKVVNEIGGTAHNIMMPDIQISGKTGTAQNPHGEDHALFVAYAPSKNPKIAVAVVVENVGYGSSHAAPIAKEIIKTYLKNNKKEMDELKKLARISN